MDAPSVAYFSMEIGLAPDLPTYSGGLGVLAGDTLPHRRRSWSADGGRHPCPPQGVLPPAA